MDEAQKKIAVKPCEHTFTIEKEGQMSVWTGIAYRPYKVCSKCGMSDTYVAYLKKTNGA